MFEVKCLCNVVGVSSRREFLCCICLSDTATKMCYLMLGFYFGAAHSGL